MNENFNLKYLVKAEGQNERLNIKYPVIVEGRYDKNRLCSVINANIIETDGFGIFSSTEKAALIRRLSECGKIIVLTDSDGAGTVIRSKISSIIEKNKLINLYIPQIHGKERRKSQPSKEGTLGVEGMKTQILHELFLPFSDIADDEILSKKKEMANLIKSDFYSDGLTGTDGCSERRDKLAIKLGLPTGMTPNALLAAVNLICTKNEYEEKIKEIDE